MFDLGTLALPLRITVPLITYEHQGVDTSTRTKLTQNFPSGNRTLDQRLQHRRHQQKWFPSVIASPRNHDRRHIEYRGLGRLGVGWVWGVCVGGRVLLSQGPALISQWRASWAWVNTWRLSFHGHLDSPCIINTNQSTRPRLSVTEYTKKAWHDSPSPVFLSFRRAKQKRRYWVFTYCAI